MNECVMTGFAWWGIILTGVWLIWVTLKAMDVGRIDENHIAWVDEVRKLRNELEELRKKVGTVRRGK